MLFIVGTIQFRPRLHRGKTLISFGAVVRADGVAGDAAAVGQPVINNSSANFHPPTAWVDPPKRWDQYNQLLAVIRATPARTIRGGISWATSTVSPSSLLVSGIPLARRSRSRRCSFWAYIIQKFILFSGYAFRRCSSVHGDPPLRSIGSRYLTNIVGVLLWPLGWAVAALITQGILDFMTDPSFTVH